MKTFGITEYQYYCLFTSKKYQSAMTTDENSIKFLPDSTIFRTPAQVGQWFIDIAEAIKKERGIEYVYIYEIHKSDETVIYKEKHVFKTVSELKKFEENWNKEMEKKHKKENDKFIKNEWQFYLTKKL